MIVSGGSNIWPAELETEVKLTTEPLPTGDTQRAEAVRAAARERVGTPREQVESQLAQRQGLPAAGGDKEQQALARERRRSDTREEPAR